MTVEGSVMQAGAPRPVRHVDVRQEWNKKLGTFDGIVSCSNVQRRLPVLVTSVHVGLMPQQHLYRFLFTTIPNTTQSSSSASYHWGQEIPTYDADTTSVALATNTATYSVQNGRVGAQMSAWYGSVLPVDLLHANLITRRSVSSMLCCIRTTLCSTHDD